MAVCSPSQHSALEGANTAQGTHLGRGSWFTLANHSIIQFDEVFQVY